MTLKRLGSIIKLDQKSKSKVVAGVLLLFLFYVEECPVDPQFLRKCVDSIMYPVEIGPKKWRRFRNGRDETSVEGTPYEYYY